MGRLAAYARATRAEQPYTIFVDAGDDHEKGSVAEELSRGVSTAQIVKSMGFDVRVLGNHDFGWGLSHLLDFSRDPQALVLSSNVRYRGSSPRDFGGVDYGELEVGCLRVGFVGMVTRPWGANDREFTGNYFPELESRFDYVRRARELVSEHRSSVDLLVMVNHLGVKEDSRIASRVEGIDLILGGHSHTVMRAPRVVGSSLIVHAGSHGSHIARLELEFELPGRRWSGYRHKLVSSAPGLLPADPNIDRAIAAIAKASAPDAGRPVFWLESAASRGQVAAWAAQAANRVLGSSAAFVDPKRVKTAWEQGIVTQQRLLDAFPIQHHPPGTEGDTAMYVVSLSRYDLLRIRRHRPEWAYWESAAGSRTPCSVALQKHMAFHPEEYLPPDVHLGTPRFAGDLWRIVEAYGQRHLAGRGPVRLATMPSQPVGFPLTRDSTAVAFAAPGFDERGKNHRAGPRWVEGPVRSPSVQVPHPGVSSR